MDPHERYVAVIQRDPDDAKYWLVEVQGIDGVHSYGRSVREAVDNAREALGAALGTPEDEPDPEVEHVVLGTSYSLADLHEAKLIMTNAERHLQYSMWTAAAELTRCGLTRADAGMLMGVSKQRVQQLLDAKDKQDA